MENIEKVSQLAVDSARANQFDRANLPAAVALPQDMRLHSLEQYGLGRDRFRGVLSTTSIEDFAAYVKAQAQAQGFVDIDKMTATVFFNLGTPEEPGHGDWRALLALQRTAAYAAMCLIDGKPFDQQALVDWLEDWNDVLVADFADGNASLSRAVASIRKMKVSAKSESSHNVGDFNASRSALEEVEASSVDALPIGFRLATEPYDGLSSRSFALKLSVLTGGDKPRLVLRWQRKEAQLEQIAREFKDVLAEKLGERTPLTIGTFNPGS